MIRCLNHVQITIPAGREDDARAFYCGVLGLREVEKPDSLKGRGGFWLELGDLQIHVGTEDGFDRRATKAHLAYEVDSADPWRARIAAAGLVVEESVPIPGCDRFETRDPFGNRLELIQPLNPAVE
jgi:catechol 2,3-dioxygenase-like lactoylglutathione lyase family enzyme